MAKLSSQARASLDAARSRAATARDASMTGRRAAKTAVPRVIGRVHTTVPPTAANS